MGNQPEDRYLVCTSTKNLHLISWIGKGQCHGQFICLLKSYHDSV